MHAQAEPGRRIVRINMDETNVQLMPDAGLGHLVARACCMRRSPVGLARNAKKGDTRATMTHCAMICDDASVQALLPQVVLMSSLRVGEALAAEVRSLLPSNIVLLRLPKAWVNVDVMVWIANEVGRRLRTLESTHRFIFLADAYKAHVSTRSLQAYARNNLWFVLVPAKLTWALQPCDTHLFALYKRVLAQRCQQLAIADGRAGGSWLRAIQALADTI